MSTFGQQNLQACFPQILDQDALLPLHQITALLVASNIHPESLYCSSRQSSRKCRSRAPRKKCFVQCAVCTTETRVLPSCRTPMRDVGERNPEMLPGNLLCSDEQRNLSMCRTASTRKVQSLYSFRTKMYQVERPESEMLPRDQMYTHI